MRLRHRLRLQRNTPTRDAAGQPVESWSTYRTCVGDVSDMSAGEGTQSDENVLATVATQVVLRMPRDGRVPQPTDRVLYYEGDTLRTLNVEQVLRTDGRRRMMRLVCTEVQA